MRNRPRHTEAGITRASLVGLHAKLGMVLISRGSCLCLLISSCTIRQSRHEVGHLHSLLAMMRSELTGTHSPRPALVASMLAGQASPARMPPATFSGHPKPLLQSLGTAMPVTGTASTGILSPTSPGIYTGKLFTADRRPVEPHPVRYHSHAQVPVN